MSIHSNVEEGQLAIFHNQNQWDIEMFQTYEVAFLISLVSIIHS